MSEKWQTFKLLSVVIRNATEIIQVLQHVSHKVCSMVLPKFATFRLFFLTLGVCAIMDQTAMLCCDDIRNLSIQLMFALKEVAILTDDWVNNNVY